MITVAIGALHHHRYADSKPLAPPLKTVRGKPERHTAVRTTKLGCRASLCGVPPGDAGWRSCEWLRDHIPGPRYVRGGEGGPPH
ncbi:hypothetical protein E2C01_063352 [Portunus trituberculatus]|uniref:Uncharacterized protein n=1 Tax=Portunus trituberculatus TaxID=210409 RepID=A0A5B7HIQ5_PORTR|nr:hypothetical protein [Portunus trituberculatus]